MACPATGGRGGQPVYSAIAIQTSLALRLVFHQPLRQTEGLLRSIADVLGINIATPDHTTLSRRGGGLTIFPKRIARAEPLHPRVWLNLCETAGASPAKGLRLGENDVPIAHENKKRVGAWPGRRDYEGRTRRGQLGRVGGHKWRPVLSDMRYKIEPTPRLVYPPSAGLAGSGSRCRPQAQAGAMAMQQSRVCATNLARSGRS
jgi:hypothetical protein